MNDRREPDDYAPRHVREEPIPEFLIANGKTRNQMRADQLATELQHEITRSPPRTGMDIFREDPLGHVAAMLVAMPFGDAVQMAKEVSGEKGDALALAVSLNEWAKQRAGK